MSSYPRISGTQSTRRRFVFWFGVFSLFLSLASPALTLYASDAAAAAAQGEPPDCDPGYVVDENTQECVPEENGEQPDCDPGFVYDENSQECVPEEQTECDPGFVFDENSGYCVPEATEESDQPVGVEVEKYECPPGEDWYSQSYDYLSSQCSPNGNTVTMTHGGPNGEDSQSGTSFFEWTNEPAGSHYVSEEIPQGYGEPIVYCGAYVPNESQPSPDQSGVQNGNTVGWDLQPGEYVHCWWFNIPVDEYNWIDFYKYECPTDLDTGGGYEYYFEECTPVEGWDFDVQWDAGGSTETTDADGKASWSGVPQNGWTGSEDLPNGYGDPAVFCRYVEWPDEAGYDNNWVQVEAPGGVYSQEFDYDQLRYECYWFNFPTDDDYNWIDFYKYECTFDAPYDEEYQWYVDNCQPVEGWEWDVSWDGGGGTQQTDGSGKASWSGVPQGDWEAQENLPDGYGQPIVWCRWAESPDEAGYSGDWERFEATDGFYESSFDYDQLRYECYWFNFAPETDYNWIDFYKYWCEYDTPTDESYEYYLENCEPREGWEFDVSWDGGGSTKTTDSEGLASWSGVPQGTWSGSETLTEGYGQPFLWCRYVEWPDAATDIDGDWFQYDLAGGSEINTGFDYDELRIECYWFNFAPDEDYNWIEIYKYYCPEGTSYDMEAASLAEDCTVFGDVSFTLESGSYSEERTTDDQGYGSWNDVPQGDWTLTEEIPDGYGEPVIYCRYVEWPDEATGIDDSTFPYEASGGSFGDSFEGSGYHLVCGIFNIPADDYNWIDFYKYECPYDFTEGGSIEDYFNNCSPVEGWDFDVQWDGGGSTQTTDAEGKASWSGVPTGSWSGSETLPEGYGQPVLWCRYVEWPEEAGYDNNWQQDGAPGGVRSGEFEYDQVRYECYWFNFTTGTNWIDFYKYECPADFVAPEGGVFEDYEGACSAYEDGVDFDVQWPGGGSTQTTDSGGKASWSGVPTGGWQAQETIPDGYGDPVIYCRWVEYPEDAPYTDEWTAYEAPGGFFDHEFEYSDSRIECYWFNIPYQQNWVEITKYWCSEEVLTPYEQPYDYLNQNCETYTEGVDFTLEYSGGPDTQTTDSSGNAEWSGLPTGPWSLHETIPDGYGDPVVYCYYVEWPNEADYTEEPSKYDAPSGSWTGEFEYGGVRIHCDVYNIPTYDWGWITVYKWYCAEGVPAESSAEYLRDNCYPVTTGVDFSLDYGNTSHPQTTDSGGKAEWGEVPTGSWSLSETTGASTYGDPVIYCQWTEWPDQYSDQYSEELYQPEQEGATITGSHDYPGLRLVCYWFNFGYEGGDNGIIIHKYWCEPDSDYGEELSAWEEGCPETSDGTSFTLTSGETTSPKSTSGGTVEWTDLGEGAFSVHEDLPPGYEEPRIWCWRAEYNPDQEAPTLTEAQFEAVSSTDGTWEGTFEGGPWRIVCYWFNIPGDENTVTVYKYTCEYEPVGFNTLGQWQEACPTKGDGIDFTLDYEGGSEPKTTADGKAEWTDVPLGEFTLTEAPYAGYGEPVVWCGWTAYYEGAIYDAFPAVKDATGGVYKGEITVPGTTYFCYWFNIPEEHSKIVVYKYNCPEGIHTEGTMDFYQEECTDWGDGIEFTLDNSEGSTTKEIANGTATWNDVPQGEFTLTENIPFGYNQSLWWCGFTGYEGGAIFDGFPKKVEAPEGVFAGSIDYDVTTYYCWVFNFPNYDREVTVYKWYCPEGYQSDSQEYQAWKSDCVQKASGVNFNLTHDGGSWSKGTNLGGKATWYGSEPGPHTLTEQSLPGYESPYVFCSLEAFYDDGAAYAEDYQWYDVSDYAVSKDLGEYANYKWICHFFNVPKDNGEITIYKWYCPPGYDVNVWGADPTKDCTQAQDGVDYVLDKPVGPNVPQTTGDSIPGGVYWGDLPQGTYTVTEMVPSDVDYTFIWDCVGNYIPKVHPNPLTWGNVLKVDLAYGDSIVCNWYNVPYPENGWVTLYKYQCWTATYKSEVDCEIYEFGATFELFAVDGNVSQGVGTTNVGGTYTWGDLEAGAYSLDEISHKPCKITSTKVNDSNNIVVDAGQGTVVKVYNCSSDGGKGTPTPGGKPPTKYPNTGVGTGVEGPVEVAQEGSSDDGTPTDEQEAAAEFYQVSCLNEPADEQDQQSDTSPSTEEPAADENGGLPPFLQPTEDTDEPEGTEEAEGTEQATIPAVTEEDCERGSVPERLVIDSADVDYEVEVLEIVDGVMQAPTGPNVVSWYKETARLGESNNIVIAGHLNWWGVPEGPFFNLQNMEEGDRIEITGEDGTTYVFEVQWVQQESNLEPPDPTVVGPTGAQTLTLITCGGEWDASISEYNARTVVRAIQVDTIPAEAPAEPEDEDTGFAVPAPIAWLLPRSWLLAA